MTVEKDANGREHLSLPARMTALFASGLDYEATLQGVVDLLVPELAAWAAIDLFDGEGLRRVAATVDAIAGHEEVIADLKQHPQQASAPATRRALELQRARIVHIENETQFVWPVRSEAHLAMYRDALPISVILAPLQAGEEVLGYLQLASIRGRRRYSESDALLVEDVAQRASFAIRTAQLVTALRGELAKRQAASHALEASEARYRRMFEASPYPVWVFDVKTLAFLAVNPAAIAQYGYSLHEFLRLTIRDIRPANEQRRLDEALRRDVRGSRDAGIFRHQDRKSVV